MFDFSGLHYSYSLYWFVTMAAKLVTFMTILYYYRQSYRDMRAHANFGLCLGLLCMLLATDYSVIMAIEYFEEYNRASP